MVGKLASGLGGVSATLLWADLQLLWLEAQQRRCIVADGGNAGASVLGGLSVNRLSFRLSVNPPDYEA
jgi:hypothetical protein